MTQSVPLLVSTDIANGDDVTCELAVAAVAVRIAGVMRLKNSSAAQIPMAAVATHVFLLYTPDI